jgi:hypothetical protein
VVPYARIAAWLGSARAIQINWRGSSSKRRLAQRRRLPRCQIRATRPPSPSRRSGHPRAAVRGQPRRLLRNARRLHGNAHDGPAKAGHYVRASASCISRSRNF